MDHYDQIYTRRLKKNVFDIRISEFDSKKPYFDNLKNNGKLGDQEVDSDYAWLLTFLIETSEQAQVSEDENENEIQNETGNETEDENLDENDKDPQYCIFLENLTENGKSYKLKISRNDEEPRFLYYEEHENITDNNEDEVTSSQYMQINQNAKRRLNEKNGEISTKKKISRRKKINEHKSVTQPIHTDSCYQKFLEGCKPSEYGTFEYKGNIVEYEKIVTTSDSDSDIMIWDNVQNCSEANNKQLVSAQNKPSLREKLMCILKQPFNKKEYDELSEYLEEKKPICRLLPLRRRSISSALDGVKKSVLDDGPGSFRVILNAAQNDQHKSLNLLRMFRFWLEHVPNEDVFEPWKDQEILEMLQMRRTK